MKAFFASGRRSWAVDVEMNGGRLQRRGQKGCRERFSEVKPRQVWRARDRRPRGPRASMTVFLRPVIGKPLAMDASTVRQLRS